MRSIRIHQVDAFTRTPLSGNPAGVVSDARGLSVEAMQAIARELNNPETAFVLPSDAVDHDLRIRFFTPTMEVPICGHATIAAHYVRARMLSLSSRIVRQKSGVGILPIEVISEDDDYRIMMSQKPPAFGHALGDEERRTVCGALHLAPESLDSNLPLQMVTTGNAMLIVPLVSSAALDGLQPDLARVLDLTSRLGANGVFVFTLDSPGDGVLTSCRMFAPALGIPEDPVTGTGNGPLGAYLVRHGVLRADPKIEFHSVQGRAMRRPGIVRVEICTGPRGIESVRVGDQAVVTFTAEMSLP